LSFYLKVIYCFELLICNTEEDEELIGHFKAISHFNCQCSQFDQPTTTFQPTISQTTTFQQTITFQQPISQQTPSFQDRILPQDNFWLWVAIVFLSVLIVAGCFCLGAVSFCLFLFQNKNKTKIKLLRADIDKLNCNSRFSVPSKKVIIFCINIYISKFFK